MSYSQSLYRLSYHGPQKILSSYVIAFLVKRSKRNLLMYTHQKFSFGPLKGRYNNVTAEDRLIGAFLLQNLILICLQKIFGPKRDEETRQYWKLPNEGLNDLYSSPNIVRGTKSRRMRWAGNVACMWKGWGLYRVLVGNPDWKPLRRSKRRWEDNIKMDLQEVGCGGVDWIDQAQDGDRWWALVNAVMNLRVP